MKVALSGVGSTTTLVNDRQNTLSFIAGAGTSTTVTISRVTASTAIYYLDHVELAEDHIYDATVKMSSDYYPFGMQMPGRNTNASNYRYGYNGMELDNETKGNGNSYTTEFRQYDPRLGRWLSLDPLALKYPGMSPYNAFNDNPIYFTDPLGLEGNPIIGKAVQRIMGSAIKALAKTIKDHEDKVTDIDEIVIKPSEDQKKSKTQDGNFTVGKYTGNFPRFSYDNGFLGTADLGDGKMYIPPSKLPLPMTEEDIRNEMRWHNKGRMAQMSWLGNAGDIYMHFLGATGKDYWVDFPDYFNDEPSSTKVLTTSIELAKAAAEELLPKSGYIEMFSEKFSTGTYGFPRSVGEDWLKTLGDFNLWLSATVSAKEINGKVNYSMTLVLHAEDKYNFNPGAKDIATGIPDRVNGRFELTGQAKQFYVYGKHYVHLTWIKP